ncbi:T9SS type A sorting domain-containing protein [Candidatus Sulfidibacterium hydrothermale]|uniref:M14 family zinc carboxypeptidase n=1 Tax=Candidatus Sulfidibacterium hydrothermale TaxID=2875962 RepID=UPI001F0B080D|nr:M14 family zinc carboxypeptidase [Candidatus Sulfidibacterium hydrothermale]UBM63197.1 T9SS type A sorting domain-containing protein [Candidatus Sulfidibacterium hydrothermale]
MKRKIFLLFFLITGSLPLLFAQQSDWTNAQKILNQRGEIYFCFAFPGQKEIQPLSRIISIDKIARDTVYAYADRTGFLQFLKTNISYRTLLPPSERLSPEKLTPPALKSTADWDYYPSYDAYLSMMQDFQNQYPDLCQIISIGKSVQGRELLFAHIGHLDSETDTLPRFMYTSTIHGDEPVGYVLMLHLIDYLLSNYGKLPEVTSLIDSVDIWINPLANPDGTYAGGNASVYGATRFNANQVDLNRNYPDPKDGDHPDGKSWQPETIAFMNFAEKYHFVLSCNLHTGSEVANYPWDTWSRRTADDNWWQEVCRQYADTVHAYARADYFRDLNDGITDGYDWYSIAGGRQDYMNYFQHTREFTLELSETKTPSPDSLLKYWDYNYRSLLAYIHQSVKGFTGTVTDSITGKPLSAQIFTINHDIDHSEVYSDSVTGYFYRPIEKGTYDFEISSPGYITKTLRNITITRGKAVVKKIQLVPENYTGIRKSSTKPIPIYPNPVSDKLFFTDIPAGSKIFIFNTEGKCVFSATAGSFSFIPTGSLPAGIYLFKVETKQGDVQVAKFVKQ